jgi:hypothetical protein
LGLRGHTAEAVLLNHTGFVELSVMCVCVRERERERERDCGCMRVKAKRTVGMSVCITPPVTFTHGGNEAVMAASMWIWLIFK